MPSYFITFPQGFSHRTLTKRMVITEQHYIDGERGSLITPLALTKKTKRASDSIYLTKFATQSSEKRCLRVRGKSKRKFWDSIYGKEVKTLA